MVKPLCNVNKGFFFNEKKYFLISKTHKIIKETYIGWRRNNGAEEYRQTVYFI